MLKVGDVAPDFCLKDKDGVVCQLSKLSANTYIVYFYPRDNTPGCTLEARDFQKNLQKFDDKNVKLIGISGGDEKSKQKFCSKQKLKFTLLSDSDGKVGKSFGVFGEKKFMGRKYLGFSRVTFILDKDKRVIKVFDKVKPLGHAKEILKFLLSN